jgi:hypothetical protein
LFNVRETFKVYKLYKNKFRYKNYITNYEQKYFEKLLYVHLQLKLENIILIYIEQIILIIIIYRNFLFKLVLITISLHKKIVLYRK